MNLAEIKSRGYYVRISSPGMLGITPRLGDNHELRAAIIASKPALLAELKQNPDRPVPAKYKRTKPKVDGLGDWVERQLSAIGITEAKYKRVKEQFGLPSTCNCASRKKWLNEVSAWWAKTEEA